MLGSGYSGRLADRSCETPVTGERAAIVTGRVAISTSGPPSSPQFRSGEPRRGIEVASIKLNKSRDLGARVGPISNGGSGPPICPFKIWSPWRIV